MKKRGVQRMEDPQNTELKQFNVGADESEHADHQTTGEVAINNIMELIM